MCPLLGHPISGINNREVLLYFLKLETLISQHVPSGWSVSGEGLELGYTSESLGSGCACDGAREAGAYVL